MGQPARQAVEIRDFPGLATEPDALDIPPGAAIVQSNMQCVREGQLSSRPGLRPVSFEEE